MFEQKPKKIILKREPSNHTIQNLNSALILENESNVESISKIKNVKFQKNNNKSKQQQIKNNAKEVNFTSESSINKKKQTNLQSQRQGRVLIGDKQQKKQLQLRPKHIFNEKQSTGQPFVKVDAEKQQKIKDRQKYSCKSNLQNGKHEFYTSQQLALSRADIALQLEDQFLQFNLFERYKPKFAGKQRFIDFICDKLAKQNPHLFFLKQKIHSIKQKMFLYQKPLSIDQQNKLIASINECLNKDFVAVIENIGVERTKAQKSVQLSENNLQIAIEITYSGEQPYVFHIAQCKSQLDQSLFLHQWLLHPRRRIQLLKFKASLKYLDYYTLSIKHQCKYLYHLLVKHRNLVEKIINQSIVNIYSNGDSLQRNINNDILR